MDAAIIAAAKDILLAIVTAWTVYQETRLRDLCASCPYDGQPGSPRAVRAQKL